MRCTALVLCVVAAACQAHPLGGARVHHVQVALGGGPGEQRTTGVRDDRDLERMASSSVVGLGWQLKYYSPSGHGGGFRLAGMQGLGGEDRPVFTGMSLDFLYAYERVIADGYASLVAFGGPSRMELMIGGVCYAEPGLANALICDGNGRWPKPPDLHDYDGVGWGGVGGVGVDGRAGPLMVGADLEWRATRAPSDSSANWNHNVMLQARLGFDFVVGR